MADQLNLLDNDRVVPIALHEEMQRSYLEYAMSVIVGRALPDVRDGLKPVQRRILYAMHELGLTPDRPYRKCARVVGDVLGKYHPHGDQSVYDALVRLVQDFSCRYPLIAGHGNFGSVDNDPPAAMRYTETRLAAISNEGMLGEIGDETVEFTDNFDSSQQEPVVLPAQLPFLLLNGCSGIAVGMATNIPPHNLGEIVDGLIALIDRPNLTDESLQKIIPGPDFPTGGEIVGLDGIEKAYTIGRGSIPVRGVANIEELQAGQGRKRRRTAIVITELPYQVNKAAWIEKVADLVNQDKLDGISDIRDESDRDGMRVVIELKREGNPAHLLQLLFQKTALQSNFGTILLTIVEGQPRQLSLKNILEEFLAFREETLTRRYSHNLSVTQDRMEIVDGLLKALGDLDRLIEILREAPDAASAKAQFQVEFDLNDRQSDAILAMPMRRITGIEQQKLHDEQEQLLGEIEKLENLLGNRKELLKSLKKDLRALKKKYNSPRRTRIQTKEAAAQFVQEIAETFVDSGKVEEPTALELSQKGYLRRLQLKAYKRQGLPDINPNLEEAEDFITQVEIANPNQDIVAFTRDGKAYSVSVREVTLIKRKGRGEPLITLLPDAIQADPDNLLCTFVLPDDHESKELIIVTQKGKVKRLPLSDCAGLTGRGLTLAKLKDGDQIQFVVPAEEGQSLILATSGGRMLRFRIRDDQLPRSNRNNQGVKAIRMRSTEQIVGCVAVSGGAELLMVSAKGFMKRMPADLLSVGNRGDLGNAGFKLALKSDSLAAVLRSKPNAVVTLVTDQERVATLDISDIKIYGKDSKGNRWIQPERSEQIVSVSVIGMEVD